MHREYPAYDFPLGTAPAYRPSCDHVKHRGVYPLIPLHLLEEYKFCWSLALAFVSSRLNKEHPSDVDCSNPTLTTLLGYLLHRERATSRNHHTPTS